jgi:2-hydroxy-3-oxopropionate reductase
MSEKLGIIGLGRMGIVAAKKYIEAGYEVYGYARRREVINEFETFGGHHMATIREVAENSDKVIVYVLNDQQVIEVVTGKDGILDGAHPGTGVICMATIDRDNLEMVARKCAEKSVGFIDCPVTGGPPRIEAGTLTLIAAGNKDFLEECRLIMEVQGKITFVGEEPGLGQAVKHCNQLLVGTTQAATMEVITLARKSGLDPKLVCEVAGSGVAGSDYFRIIAQSVNEGGASIGGLGQMIKDVGLVVNDARRVNTPLLVVNAAYQYYLSALSLGLENADTSDLIKVLEKMTQP